MARRTALPTQALDTLMREVKPRKEPSIVAPASARRATAPRASSRSARRAPARAAVRPGAARVNPARTRPAAEPVDALVSYAASRGVPLHAGPVESVRLAVQLAIDVREAARRDRIGIFTVVTRALAGYLHARDGNSSF